MITGSHIRIGGQSIDESPYQPTIKFDRLLFLSLFLFHLTGEIPMTRKLIFLILICIGIQSSALAAGNQGISKGDFYIGGGFSTNSLGGGVVIGGSVVGGWDDAIGFQFFGGYKLPIDLADASHSVEVGYMDSGDFDSSYISGGTTIKASQSASGLWGTYTFIWPASDVVSLIARGGLDIGDDDGLMIGGGVEFNFDAAVTLRLEMVVRDNIDSLQVNVAYQL